MMEIFTLRNANQKLYVLVMIVAFMITIIIPMQNVQATGTNYYVVGTDTSDNNEGWQSGICFDK